MCSICGIALGGPTAPETIRIMNDASACRGPDGSGEFTDEMVSLGHRRLAIVDLAGGKQPMFNEDRTLVLVCNGEIYNYPQLRQELESKGHRFATNCDSECILHVYEEYDVSGFSKLLGMFAFAVYDIRRRKIVLVRDRLGQKPLCYFRLPSGLFAFASVLESLKRHPKCPRMIDRNAVVQFLSLQYIAAPNTIYRGVHKLPPGCFLEYNLADYNCRISRYWQLDFCSKSPLPFDEATAKLRELVLESVRARQMADVPCGAFLSGGLDSTITAALTAQLRGSTETDAFSIGFAERAYDESNYAALAAASIHSRTGGFLRHATEIVDPCDFDLLKELVLRYGEPFSDASMLPTYLLCRFASRQVKVALSGDGADELFAGYERYNLMRYAAKLRGLPPALVRSVFCYAASRFKDAGERTRSGRIRRACLILAAPENERYFKVMDRCSEQIREILFGDELLQARPAEAYFEEVLSQGTSADAVECYLELDLQSYLCGDILSKVDIASMANGLEVRSPFLDHRVVEFAASLPMEYKLCGADGKHILKAAFADLVPQAILNRAKKGFGVPVANWLRGAWHDQTEELLFGGKLAKSGLIKPTGISTLWELHQSGSADYSYLLWNLLIFELFLESER